MICNTCGENVREDAVCCPNCGFNPKDKKHEVKKSEKDNNSDNKNTVKSVSTEGLFVVWGILGFFIPLAGLILFIIWNKDKKKDAMAAGIGALIRVIIMVSTYALYFVFWLFNK